MLPVLRDLAPSVMYGGGLVAFITAVIAWTLSQQLNSRAQRLSQRSLTQISDAIGGPLPVPKEIWDELPPEERARVLLKEMEYRYRKFKLYCWLASGSGALVLAFFLGVLLIMPKANESPSGRTPSTSALSMPVSKPEISVNGVSDRLGVKRGELLILEASWKYVKAMGSAHEGFPSAVHMVWTIDGFPADFAPAPQDFPYRKGESDRWLRTKTDPVPDSIPTGTYGIRLAVTDGKGELKPVPSNTVYIEVE